MKKIIVAVMLAAFLASTAVGCGSDKTIGGKTYTTYGLFNTGENKNPKIRYEPIWGNIFWGIILFETIIAPIYFFGFSLNEPAGPASGDPGVVNQ